MLQIRGFPCECEYPEHCDSQKSTLPPTRLQQREMNQATPAEYVETSNPQSSSQHGHLSVANGSSLEVEDQQDGSCFAKPQDREDNSGEACNLLCLFFYHLARPDIENMVSVIVYCLTCYQGMTSWLGIAFFTKIFWKDTFDNHEDCSKSICEGMNWCMSKSIGSEDQRK